MLSVLRIFDCVCDCGFEAFGESLDLDYRGLFIDINATQLFGDTTPDLSHITSCILDSHIPFYVRKYCRELHQQLSEHNVYDRFI